MCIRGERGDHTELPIHFWKGQQWLNTRLKTKSAKNTVEYLYTKDPLHRTRPGGTSTNTIRIRIFSQIFSISQIECDMCVCASAKKKNDSLMLAITSYLNKSLEKSWVFKIVVVLIPMHTSFVFFPFQDFFLFLFSFSLHRLIRRMLAH